MQTSIAWLYFLGAVGLIVIGAAGLVLARHLFRRVLALAIAEAGANLLLVLAGFRWYAEAPIVTAGNPAAAMVDPIPQAMVLTAIVIGVGVQALALALVIRIKQAYGTLDMREIQIRLELDIARDAGVPLPTSEHAPRGERPLPQPHPEPVYLNKQREAQ